MVALVAGSILVFVVIAFVVRRSGLPKRFAVVEPGVLYRSGQPSTTQIQHLASTDGPGIHTILIVREGTSRRVPDEIEFAEELGLNVIHMPIKSRKPIPDDQIEEFFRYVDDPAFRPVLVHCSAGRHRTGLLCALYRIERQNWPLPRAIEEMLSFGFDSESQSAVLRQLEQYVPRSATESSGPGA